jgi:hypothetical protein
LLCQKGLAKEATMRRIALCIIPLVLMAGCKESRQAPSRDGVNIVAPGVDVNIEKKEGVKVRAPGVDVDVDRK